MKLIRFAKERHTHFAYQAEYGYYHYFRGNSLPNNIWNYGRLTWHDGASAGPPSSTKRTLCNNDWLTLTKDD